MIFKIAINLEDYLVKETVIQDNWLQKRDYLPINSFKNATYFFWGK
jgi:hypothetical protein